MQYKPSRFLIKSKLENDEILVLNTTNCALIKMTKDKWKSLIEKDFSQFSIDEVDNLKNMGFIVESTCNEMDLMSKKRLDTIASAKNESLRLTVLTTTACNARCFYCYEKGVKTTFMDQSTAETVVDFIEKKHGDLPVHLSWFGGEPLLNKNIIDYICKELQKRRIEYKTSMVSNGSLFANCSDEQLKLWQLENVQVTLDGCGEDYNKTKNYVDKEIKFEKILDNIAGLLNEGIGVSIRINFCPDDISNYEKLVQCIHDTFGVRTNLHVYFANIVDDKVMLPLDYSGSNNPFVKAASILMKYGYAKTLKDLLLRPRTLPCGTYRNYYVIDPTGKIYKCEHMVNDDEECVGDVKNGITKLECYKKWTTFRLPYKKCYTCKALPLCQGGCKAYSFMDRENAACVQIKNCIPLLMKLYYESNNL